ncbi:bile acid-CoA:amino acid N-acyltransferase-like isoform X1 [Osmerus eperlanus]|uniref:bile acid-CoA:amino acid N-acyltransferase-like isoform X1 n=2 Tax=Osmerus eperlanus TaxID=29151 RepID=UPI002E0D26FF
MCVRQNCVNSEMYVLQRINIHRKVTCLQHGLAITRWGSNCRPAPLLTISPTRSLIDEQVTIEGRYLPPFCRITMRACLQSEDGDLWETHSHYNTDKNGRVNLTRDVSVGGSYVGCEPMGLFWSLQPAHGERKGLRLRKKNVETPYPIQISILDGHVTFEDNNNNNQELAAVTVERWYMAPGVRRMEIRQNGIVGTLFLPPGPGPFPAMVDLWGMGGGLVEYRSALCASRGFASLALAYFGHSDIPGPLNCINVGDQYFRAALKLLQEHPKVCGDRIGVMGLSFGVYLSLRIATQIGVSPRCVICINGPIGSFNKLSDNVSGSKSFEGDQKHWSFNEQGYVSFREVSLPNNIPPENKVKLENLCCPLLYIVGEDDLSCAAMENANEIEESLKAAGKSHLLVRLSYPGAGHLIEPPYTPNARASMWTTRPKKLITLWGGHLAPHAAAQEHAWTRILEFMECNLRG